MKEVEIKNIMSIRNTTDEMLIMYELRNLLSPYIFLTSLSLLFRIPLTRSVRFLSNIRSRFPLTLRSAMAFFFYNLKPPYVMHWCDWGGKTSRLSIRFQGRFPTNFLFKFCLFASAFVHITIFHFGLKLVCFH
jgi:hypothetical protein